ncbi:MAG: Gldg family protein [Candidatus Hydrogenedentes bacterium]|nr:Gldg family protein [Candidatus Hydrogenedentota bacterium]
MNNVRTIFRRDLGAFFTSPIGYIFIIVFLVISVGLFITSFFQFPVADMRSYFGNLPLLMCVFIPAVTMRVWAEERKENTWEMLLTFPMRAWELVIGKFLATFIFFAITVACTFTVPLMLIVLGNPDNGAILGGYLGTLLLGAFFLSIGIFVSGFCRDQIVAFVVSLLACFAIFLLGTNFIASYIDGFVSGLGSNLSTLVGMVEHYQTFTRGVVELVDIIYFLVWTLLFLVLNIMFIEQRNRPGSRFSYALAVTFSCGIGLLFNYIVTDMSLGRFDLTEDNTYTVSPATRTILSNLESPAQIKVYISPKDEMPTALKTLEQDITDKLAELKIAAGGKLEFTPVYLRAANVIASQEDMLAGEAGEEKKEDEETEAEKLEKLMLSRGVQPFMASAFVNDEVTQKAVYSSIGIGYLDAKEEILPQVVPDSLPELEYRLVNTIYKLSRKEPPRVALVAPKEAVNIPPQLRQIYAQMGQPVPESEDPYEFLQMILEQEKYAVDRVELTQQSALPEEYSTLVIVNPREFNDRQKWEINRALLAGKNVVLAVQNYEWEYRLSAQGELNLSKREQNPQVNDLLASYGLGVNTEILMDVNQVPLTIRSGNPLEALMGGTTVKLPMHMLINNSTMDTTAPITNRLSTIFYLWGSHLDIKEDELKKSGLTSDVVMTTTDGAWTVPADQKLSNEDIEVPAQGQQYPLMAVVSGQFPDAYKDQPRPAWPPAQPAMQGMPPEPVEPETGEPAPVTPAPGKLVLLGCSQMFNKNFIQGSNLDLFLNAVDAITLGEDIVAVRGQKPIDRAIDKPTDGQRSFWRFMNFAAVNVVIAGIGIVMFLARRQSRNAYTMAHQPEQSA